MEVTKKIRFKTETDNAQGFPIILYAGWINYHGNGEYSVPESSIKKLEAAGINFEIIENEMSAPQT